MTEKIQQTSGESETAHVELGVEPLFLRMLECAQVAPIGPEDAGWTLESASLSAAIQVLADDEAAVRNTPQYRLLMADIAEVKKTFGLTERILRRLVRAELSLRQGGDDTGNAAGNTRT